MNFKDLYKSANDNICADRNLIAEIYEKAEKRPGFFIRNYRQFAVCAAGLIIIATLSVAPQFAPKPSENNYNKMVADNRSVKTKEENINSKSEAISDDILADKVNEVTSETNKNEETATNASSADETIKNEDVSKTEKERPSKKISEHFTAQIIQKSTTSEEKDKKTYAVEDKKQSKATKETPVEAKNTAQEDSAKKQEKGNEEKSDDNYTKYTNKPESKKNTEEKQSNVNEELQVASFAEPIHDTETKENTNADTHYSAKTGGGSGGGGGYYAGGGGGSGGGSGASSSSSVSSSSPSQYCKYIGFDPLVFFNATTDGITFEKIIRTNVDEATNDYFVFDAVNRQNSALSINVAVCSEQRYSSEISGTTKKLNGYDVTCQILENSNRAYFKIKNMCVEITTFGLDYENFEKYLISVLKKI